MTDRGLYQVRRKYFWAVKNGQSNFGSRGEILGLGALLSVLFCWTLAPLQGYDFWYYLAVGKELFESHHIPWSESFLGTTESLSFGRYANQTWLSSVYFYPAYLIGGAWGLIVAKSLLLTLISAITYINCRLLKMGPWLAASWVTLGLWTVRSRFLLRTYHFSDLCLAFLVLILLKFHDQPKRRLFITIALFVLWTNLHQGVIAGWVLIGLWTVGGGAKLADGVKLVTACVVASLIRPYGWLFPSFLYDHFANQRAVGGVMEWGPLSFKSLAIHLGPFLAVSAIGFLWSIGVAKRWKEIPRYHLLVGVAFVVLSIRSQRAVSELLPVAVPLFATLFPTTFPRKIVKLGLPAVALLLLWFSRGTYDYNNLGRLYPQYPTQLAKLERSDTGQLFNSYEYGSFLAFKDVPPFIHGTTSLFQEQLVVDFQDVVNPTPRRPEIIENFGVTSFLLHLPSVRDPYDNLHESLHAAPDWRLDAWDDSGVLFRKGKATEGLHAVLPWRENRWEDPVAAKNELLILVERVPSARAHLMLSELFSAEEDWQKALRHARLASERVPTDYYAWQARTTAAMSLNDLEEMKSASAQAVHWGSWSAKAHFTRALVLLKTSPNNEPGWWERRQMRHHLERAIEIDPSFQPALTFLSQLGP